MANHKNGFRSLTEAYQGLKEDVSGNALMAKALEEVMWGIQGPGDRSGIPAMAIDMVKRNPPSPEAVSQAIKAQQAGKFKYIASGDYYYNEKTGNTYPEEGHEGGDPAVVKVYPAFIDWVNDVASKEIF